MADTTTRLPALSIPHGGGPCFFMDWDPPGTWDAMAAWLSGLLDSLPERPRAILVVSAHWLTEDLAVTSGERPGLIYDYGGFPPHTYELTHPAPGDPALASRVVELLTAAGFEAREDPERGWDHGVFIPLKVMDPDARVPIVAMSLRRSMDPTEHLAIGAALAPLRDEGVLILGSGMSYHNLRAFGPAGAEAAETFDTWLTYAVEGPAVERDARLASWTEAPAARQAHPHEDHLLPTMVAAGAARGEPGRRIYGDPVMGLAISGYAFGA